MTTQTCVTTFRIKDEELLSRLSRSYVRVEGVVALLLAEDALAVFGRVRVGVLLVLPVELREPDCEREQHQQEETQKLPKLLQHLTHRDLQGSKEFVVLTDSFDIHINARL